MIFRKNKTVEAHEYLAELFETDKDKAVRVEVVKEKRSTDQNALYWLWLTAIQQETGNGKDDLHDYFAKKYLPMDEVKIFDKLIYKRASTTKLNTDTFTQYLNKIQLFAGEQGIELPNPKDKHFEEFKNYYEKYL